MSVNTSGVDAPMCDVNTTPLIDVMLVMLVMLIVTLPISTHAVKLDMPKADNQPPPPVQPRVIDTCGPIVVRSTTSWRMSWLPRSGITWSRSGS